MDCTGIVIVAYTEDKAVFDTDCTEMKDSLCNQILNSTLIWNCRLDGYKLRSVGMGCAAVQMVWLCGHGSTVAWKNGCRYESNPARRYSCFGLFLIFHLFVPLFDISTFPGAGKSVCPFGIGHWMPGERTFSATETVIKNWLLQGAWEHVHLGAAAVSFCLFPYQQYGETQRAGSRSRNSVYSSEITDIQFTLEFSVSAFFLPFYISG